MNVLEIDLVNHPFSEVERILKLLSGKTRIGVLRTIADGRDWNLTNLARQIGCEKGNLSSQITQMEEAGLLIRKPVKIMSHMKMIKPIYDRIIIKLRDDVE